MSLKRAAWKQTQHEIDPARVVLIDETWAKTNMTRTHGRRLRDTADDRRPGQHGDVFPGWVQQHLTGTLHPGNIAVMGNLNVHKAAGVRTGIEEAGSELRFLPPYSPDLNPIELAFSKLKNFSGTAPNARATNCGTCAAKCSTSSRPRNTLPTSDTADTAKLNAQPH